VVLFTSAIVVGALLLLGAALHALLAKSLYTQQSYDAVQQVQQLTRQNELGEVSGFTTAQVQERLRERLVAGPGGQPSFKALVLRGTDGAETLRFHDIEMDVMAHQVTKNGKSVNLTPLEFELLATLARRPRQVFTREVLLEQVWGYRYAGDTRLVNVHVQRLRAKIEDDPENPRVVQTVRGVGYRIGPEGGASESSAQAGDQG
jgi:DNA-binding response OmpR family regulator